MNEHVRATEAVVEFITQARWRDFPSDAVALAKRCVIDGLGVILAGSTTRGSAILRDYIRTSGGSAEATVLGRDSFRTSAGSAALANGASGHAMDFDDTQLSTTPDLPRAILRLDSCVPPGASQHTVPTVTRSGPARPLIFLIGKSVGSRGGYKPTIFE